MKILPVALVAAMLVYIAMANLQQHYNGTTIHLVGDSTMAIQEESRHPMTGWGEPFASMLCNGIRVINHAKNGRSSKSFLAEGLWSDLLGKLRPDDMVLIQFGHNDQKHDDPERSTTPHDEFKINLQRFILDVRARHSEPVLLTSIVRREFDAQGALRHTHGDYPAATRMIADKMQTVLVDLNILTHQHVSALGPIKSKDYFLYLTPGSNENYIHGEQDNTHLNRKGAHTVASLAADELEKHFADLICR